jgi:hypothetical protein
MIKIKNLARLSSVALAVLCLTLPMSPACAIDLIFQLGPDHRVPAPPAPPGSYMAVSITTAEQLAENPHAPFVALYEPIQQKTIDALANYPQLEHVCFVGEVNHLDLSPLAKLPNLRWLQIETPINQAQLTDLQRLTNLEQLRIGEVHAENLSSLQKLPKLQRFEICAPISVSTVLVAAGFGCTDLYVLDRRDGEDLAFEALRTIKNLKLLDLRCEKVSRRNLEAIAECFSLDKLELMVNQPNDLEALSPLTALHELTVCGTPDSRHADFDTRVLANLTSLERLHLPFALNKQQLNRLSALPNLHNLSVIPTDDDAVNAFALFTKLKILSLATSRIHGGTLGALKKSNVAELNVSGCPLEAQAISELLTIRSLRSLNISETAFHDDQIGRLGKLPHLERLLMGIMKCATPYGAELVAAQNPTCLIEGERRFEDGIAMSNMGVRVYNFGGNATHSRPVSPREERAAREHQLRDALDRLSSSAEVRPMLAAEANMSEFYLSTDRPKQAEFVCRMILRAIPDAQRLSRGPDIQAYDDTSQRQQRLRFVRNVEIITRIQLLEALLRQGRIAECASAVPDIPEEECPQDYIFALNQARYTAVSAVVHSSPTAKVAIDKMYALVKYPRFPGGSHGAAEGELIALAYLCAGNLKRATTFEQRAIDSFSADTQLAYKRRWIEHSIFADLVRDTAVESSIVSLVASQFCGGKFSYRRQDFQRAIKAAYDRLRTPWSGRFISRL